MYKFIKKDGKYQVIKAQDNAVVAEGAIDELSLAFGGEVKALNDDGLIGGHAVIFSTKKDPDLAGDFFTKSTDFFNDGSEEFSIPFVLYHHGLDPEIKTRRIGTNAKAKLDSVGVWVEAQLNKRDKYEKAILDMVKKKKLGYSTGSVPHLVSRKAADDQPGEITAWPIIELSLTPTPLEPRTAAVMSIKAYTEELDLDDDRPEALKAVISGKDKNDLPDSAFAYIEPGGTKDDGGKTKPRRLRHFPYKTAEGKLDEAHVRNALARIPQSKLSADAKASALKKIRAAAKELGIQLTVKKSLHERLNQFIADSEDAGLTRDDVIKSVAHQSMSPEYSVSEVLDGNREPTVPQLKALSRVLGIEYDLLSESISQKQATSVKGIFEDQLAEDEYKTWELWSALCKVVTKIVGAAVSVPLAGATYDWDKAVDEAVDEYTVRLREVIKSQVEDYLDSGKTEYNFYLRALGDPTEEDFVMAKGMAIEDHCSLAVSAFKSIDARIRQNHANRVMRDEKKAGRAISDKNANAFKRMLEAMEEHLTKAKDFLASIMPKEKSPEAESAKAITERSRQRAQRLRLEVKDNG